MKLTLTFLILTLALAYCRSQNQPCNGTTPCDRFAGLICDTRTETCACLEPTFMVYDVDQSRCLSLTGIQGNCYRRPINDVERPCIKDAVCMPRPEDPNGDSPFGYCKCIRGFVASEQRFCEKSRLGFRQECDNEKHICEIRSGLICEKESKLCACVAPEFMVHNEEELRCLSLADSSGNCFREPIAGFERPCIPNAECLPRPENPNSPFGYCDCVLGFFKYQDRTCGPIQATQSYGEICNSTHYCNVAASLLCDQYQGQGQEGICECADPNNMVFDEDLQTCRSLAQGPGNSCYTSPIGGVLRECVKNAKCEPNPEIVGHGFCVCAEGFVAYEDRTCDVPKFTQVFGDTCNATHSCDRSAILECNYGKETCACVPFSGMVYEESSKACVTLVGEEYSCFLEPIGDVQRNCIKNAICLPRSEVVSKFGYCSCAEGLVTLADKSCGTPQFTQRFGENCNLTHSCDRTSILNCKNESESCTCAYAEDFYDTTRGKCYSPPGGICNGMPIQGQKRECPLKAECKIQGNNHGICECNEGHIPGGNGTCVVGSTTTTTLPPNGPECETSSQCEENEKCDDLTKKCICKDDSDDVQGKCVKRNKGQIIASSIFMIYTLSYILPLYRLIN